MATRHTCQRTRDRRGRGQQTPTFVSAYRGRLQNWPQILPLPSGGGVCLYPLIGWSCWANEAMAGNGKDDASRGLKSTRALGSPLETLLPSPCNWRTHLGCWETQGPVTPLPPADYQPISSQPPNCLLFKMCTNERFSSSRGCLLSSKMFEIVYQLNSLALPQKKSGGGGNGRSGKLHPITQ